MECNKDEAVRARGIAEQKMRNGDFEGAKKFALKAKKLFPGLENISQLLTICDVHYCAKHKLYGSEMDWYGILQIEQSADEGSIRKQYRKLGLLLHPDKNKYAGAEAAFKLIGEAKMILSDQMRRSKYDMKCRISVKTPPKPTSQPSNRAAPKPNSQPSNRASSANSRNNYQNGSSKFTASDSYRQAQRPTFWTLCSVCSTKYQYYIDFLNVLLHCPTCGYSFIARDMGPNCKVSSQCTGGKPSGVQFSHRFAGPTPNPKGGSSAPLGGSKKQEKVGVSMRKPHEGLTAQQKVGVSRQKHVPHEEKSKVTPPSNANKENMGDDASKKGNSVDPAAASNICQKGVKQKATAPPEETIPKKSKTGESKQEKPFIFDNNVKMSSQVDNGSEPNKDVNPSPEFSDFKKQREENCFAANQIWAAYDTRDGMPRRYARVMEVFNPDFRLRLIWLDYDPCDFRNEGCYAVDLPVTCGVFCNGPSRVWSDRSVFSHQIDFIKSKGTGKGCFLVYPRKGETWALFKDWDVKWALEPKKHQPPYRYDFVEVLTDFDEKTGIAVAHLEKVKGFVSIFQQTKGDVTSFQVSPRELNRFSHRIPSFRMTGKERKGVPVGSFELDPASLPSNLDEQLDPADMKL
ncbi:hypothetical protein PTKIN_Ptkin06aG0159800 [Pterospermum kingtungense]